MAASDARPVPLRNTAFRAVFPILDADGDLVTAAASLDSEVSKDQGTFADCTNEATEIATSSGMYYLDLTATEMDADCVAVIVKTGTAGAKTTILVFYPEETGDINADVTAWLGTAAATPTVAGVPEVDVTHWIGTAAATPTVAGVPEVDVTHFGGSAATAASGRPEVNTTHVGGTLQTAGDLKASLNTIDDFVDTEVADIQARLPAALVSGRIDASVGALAAGIATSIRSFASGTSDSGSTTTMVDAARTEADTDYWKGALIEFTSGTISGQARVITAFDAATDTITFAPATTQAVSTQTYEILAVGDFLRPTVSGRTIDVSSGGEAGLDWANIGSPATAQNLSATNIDADQVVASVTGAVGSVTGAVGSVTAGVTLAASAIQAIWDALTSALTTVGSIGKLLVDNVNATISSRASQTSVDTVDDFIDTEVASILAAVDTEVAAIKAKTDNLPEGIQKNTALSNFEFFMSDSTDHVTGKTGLTVTAERSIDGGAFAACANAVTEVGAGIYKINLATTDTNGDVITLKFTGTGADATLITFKTEV